MAMDKATSARMKKQGEAKFKKDKAEWDKAGKKPAPKAAPKAAPKPAAPGGKAGSIIGKAAGIAGRAAGIIGRAGTAVGIGAAIVEGARAAQQYLPGSSSTASKGGPGPMPGGKPLKPYKPATPPMHPKSAAPSAGPRTGGGKATGMPGSGAGSSKGAVPPMHPKSTPGARSAPSQSFPLTPYETAKPKSAPKKQAGVKPARDRSGGTGTGWTIYDNPSDVPAKPTATPTPQARPAAPAASSARAPMTVVDNRSYAEKNPRKAGQGIRQGRAGQLTGSGAARKSRSK